MLAIKPMPSSVRVDVMGSELVQGDVVKGFRTLCGFTQQELADKISVTKGALASWEMGRTALKLDIVKDLIEAFDESAGVGGMFQEAIMRCKKGL